MLAALNALGLAIRKRCVRQISEEVVEHKGSTIRRMVEELSPKIICDKADFDLLGKFSVSGCLLAPLAVRRSSHTGISLQRFMTRQT